MGDLVERSRFLLVLLAAILVVGTAVPSLILFKPMLSGATAGLKYLWEKDAKSADSADLNGKFSIGEDESGVRILTLEATVRIQDTDDTEGTKDTGSAEVTEPAPNPVNSGSQLAKARNFSAQADMLVVFIAIIAAGSLTAIRVIAGGSFASTKVDKFPWAAALSGALVGLIILLFDPIGPVVSLAILPDSLPGALWGLFPSDRGVIIDAAVKNDVVTATWPVTFMLLIVASLGGAVAALVVRFLREVVQAGDLNPMAEKAKTAIPERMLREANENLEVRMMEISKIQEVQELARSLFDRKEGLTFVLVCASLTLSLGIAMMSLFLAWGSKFLTDESLKVIEPIVTGGTNYWGSLFTLSMLVAAALTGYWLKADIDMAAKAVAEGGKKVGDTDEDKLKAEIAWIKAVNLEFDPLKSLATIVAALGPVLTSVVLNVVGKGLG